MDYFIELIPTFIFGGIVGGLFVYLFKKRSKK